MTTISEEKAAPHGERGGPKNGEKKKGDKRPPPPCPYCTEPHWLERCPEFEKKNTEERKQWIKDNKRCWRCAREHMAKQCTLKRPCHIKECGRTHLTVLHDLNDRRDKPETRETTQDPSAETEEGRTYYVGPVRGNNSRVLLKMVPVVLRHDGKEMSTYAIIDDGAERTLLLKEAANALGLKGQPHQMNILTIRPEPTKVAGEIVSLEIMARGRPGEVHPLCDVFTAADLSLSKYGYPIKALKAKYPHLSELELDQEEEVVPTILLGSDHARLTLPRRILPGPRGCPVALDTPLGWTLQGPINLKSTKPSQTRTHYLGAEAEDGILMENVRKLWQLDVTPFQTGKQHMRSKEDQMAMALLKEKTRRVETRGVLRYATPLLRKEPMPTFRVSREVAMPCLRSTEKRLGRDPETAAAYAEEMTKLVESGLVRKLEPAEEEASAESWYLPHHNVKHNGKNRVVFNCSFQVREQNLNKHLLPGPTLTPSLLGVMVRFRRQQTAISGDIRRMFHQVLLLDEDKPLMRFWEVLPFGTTCSPCCATYAMQAHVMEGTVPEGVADVVLHSFYVDNCLHSTETPEEARRLVRDLLSHLATAGFDVRQWASNDPEVLRDLPAEAKSDSSETWVTQSSDDAHEMTLGLLWSFKTDRLCYRYKEIEPRKYVTMRAIYRTLARQYDPLGYINPYTTRAKVLYNPPSAPHFGGVWEREVRSVKAALNFALGGQVPKAEVFATVLVEVEAILNSKPLGYTSSDLADLDPITPNSLLMGRPDTALPLAAYASTDDVSDRTWKYSQAVADQFWRRYPSEYLPNMQGRRKWHRERSNLEVGTPVMLVDPALPRAHWLLGRVKTVVKGKDGRVRSAIVDTCRRTYHRPVAPRCIGRRRCVCRPFGALVFLVVKSAIQEHALAAQSPEGPRKRLVSLDPDQFQLTPFSPPHSTCTNDPAAPHYEHEDICQAHRGASADEPLNLSSECVPPTCGGSEGEPSTSTSIALPNPPQEVRGPEPERRRRKRHAGDEDAYQKLLKMETEMAVKQIEQAN
ncbi:hypothetical protein N1851_019843 [Merluccius polli]|uniref:DUF5641 domain-containing protein n=1 Tax=Merluccius polli TaxID=89951 RepID=A0AA47MLQ0_MERPO|nr:hypothetical protein N1851_019843 [Merluccius polli]